MQTLGAILKKVSRKSSLQNIELQRFTIYHRYKTFRSDTQSQRCSFFNIRKNFFL